MSVKGTECSELCGVMYVEPSVLKSHAGEQGKDVRDILD